MVGQVQARLADSGVEVLDVELARLGPDDEPDELRGLLDAAAAIGARHVVGQLPDPDRSRATDHFGRLCDLAADFGLTVDLEFPSWMEVGDLGTAAAIVEDVGRPNAGILVDTLHFFRSGSSLEDLASLPGGVVPLRPALRRPGRRSTDRRRGHPRRPGGPVAPRLWPAATRRAARDVAGRALRAGGAERRAAQRARHGGVCPARPDDGPRARRRLRAGGAGHDARDRLLPDSKRPTAHRRRPTGWP